MFIGELRDESNPLPPQWFDTTLWHVVVSAGGATGSSESHAALEKLCRVYWRPLYAYVRSRGYSSHDAEDLTQEFFARILERNYLHRADPDRGKFRSFLLGAMKNFLADEHDRARAIKRGGGTQIFSLDQADLENLSALDHSQGTSPESIYEKRWAVTLLEEAMERLRKEYTATGKAILFEELKKFLSTGSEGRDYSESAAALGLTPNHVAVNVHRLRQRYRELVRLGVSNTVSTEQDVDEEMRYLIKVFST